MKKQFYSISNSAAVLLLCLIVNFNISAQTYQWKSLPTGAGGFVSGIITSKQEPNLMYARTDVGGAYKWNAATSGWTPLQDWSSVTQSGFYGVESIAIDPQATNKLYMLVGISYFDNGKTAILKSDDYGQTFTTIDVSNQFKAHGNGMGRSNGERLQVDPNLGSTLYVGTRYNGLWKSTDSGLTWSRLAGLNVNTTPNGNGISFVLIDSTSGGTAGMASETIFVGVSRFSSTGDNLYKSTDGGITFNPVTGGPADYMPQRANLTANGDMIINYANGAGPYGTTAEPMNNGGIWKYNTISGTWANITPSGIAKAWGGISVDLNNPNRIIASTINNYQLQYGNAYGDRIYYTTNGGTTWTDIVARGFSLNANGIPWITGQAIHWAGSVEFDPFNSSRVFITSGNGVFSNDNIDVASTQWKFDVKGLEETVPLGIVSIPGGPLFTIVGDYDGFKYTDINQYGQRFTPTMGTTTGIAYAGNNPNVLIRVGSRIYYTINQGATWTQSPVINGTQGRVAVSADGTTFLHSPNGSAVTYYSRNNGATWTASDINLTNAVPVADMVNPGKIYIYNSSNGDFNVSNDGGATFAPTVNIGTGGSRIIRTVPGQEGHIWVAMYNGGLKRSVNSGNSFTTISSVQRCSAIGLGKTATGAAYFTLYMWGTVGGVTGIFRSTDEGATWVRLNDDAYQFGGPGNGQFVMGDMNTYGLVYMSTVGRGVIAGQEASASLPVSLSGFTVREIERNGKHLAQLTWKTASESNAGYFNIERSRNAGSWISIYSLPSKGLNGNSSSVLQYEYADDVTGMNGMVYYRLKMVDNDGHITYSSTGSVRLGNGVNKFSIALLPNPVIAKQNATVRIISDKVQKVVLRVVAPNGTILYTKAITLAIGSTNLSLPEVANYPSGLYALDAVSAETGRSIGVVRFAIR